MAYWCALLGLEFAWWAEEAGVHSSEFPCRAAVAVAECLAAMAMLHVLHSGKPEGHIIAMAQLALAFKRRQLAKIDRSSHTLAGMRCCVVNGPVLALMQ